MTRQTDGKSLYEQQEERILAQSDAFISLLTKRGILGDHQIDNEKVRKAKQEKNRKSYHNTQLLLQHYRNIAWLLECLPVDVAAELDEPFEGVDKLIDQMDLEIALGNRKLENRMEGIVKSRLDVYKRQAHNGISRISLHSENCHFSSLPLLVCVDN